MFSNVAIKFKKHDNIISIKEKDVNYDKRIKDNEYLLEVTNDVFNNLKTHHLITSYRNTYKNSMQDSSNTQTNQNLIFKNRKNSYRSKSNVNISTRNSPYLIKSKERIINKSNNKKDASFNDRLEDVSF